jgi:hypothetical protein
MMNHEPTLAKVRLTDGLGPLPEADGTAETNKERHPEGGYTFDEVDAWSEPLVRAYAAQQVAAVRERCAALCDLHSRLTWNDDRKAQSRVLAAEIRRGA